MNIVITGANRGIGLALTRAYLSQGARVFALCRAASDKLKSTRADIIEGIDVLDDSCLVELCDRIKSTLKPSETIDIVINNAGILTSESIHSMDFENVTRQFNVNSVAPLKVTLALLPLLANGSKIAMITSRMGSMADNTSGGRYGYRMSKAALNAASVSLAYDLKDSGIAVAILHPGHVQTDMVGDSGEISPEKSAAGIVKRIDELSLNNTGGFWHSNGQELPW